MVKTRNAGRSLDSSQVASSPKKQSTSSIKKVVAKVESPSKNKSLAKQVLIKSAAMAEKESKKKPGTKNPSPKKKESPQKDTIKRTRAKPKSAKSSPAKSPNKDKKSQSSKAKSSQNNIPKVAVKPKLKATEKLGTKKTQLSKSIHKMLEIGESESQVSVKKAVVNTNNLVEKNTSLPIHVNSAAYLDLSESESTPLAGRRNLRSSLLSSNKTSTPKSSVLKAAAFQEKTMEIRNVSFSEVRELPLHMDPMIKIKKLEDKLANHQLLKPFTQQQDESMEDNADCSMLSEAENSSSLIKDKTEISSPVEREIPIELESENDKSIMKCTIL